jgi:Domain of unknown function (DUF397)
MWVKASASFSNGNCVEVKPGEHGTVLVRNSRHPDDPPLAFTREVWARMTASIKSGGLDHTLASVEDIEMDAGTGRSLWFTPDEWAAFLDGVKNGEFDHLTRQAGDR